MRILILSQYFWPEAFRINEVAKSLLELGIDVTVLTGQPNYPAGDLFPGYSASSLGTEFVNGLTIHRVPLMPRGGGSAIRLACNYLSFILSASVFGPWLLRGVRFDIVLVYAPSPILQAIPAMWLARLKRAKLVTWVQDLWPDSLRATGFIRNQQLLDFVGTVVRWIYRNNDMLLVQSKAFVEPVRQMAFQTPVVYLPNPGEIAFSDFNASQEIKVKLQSGFNVVFAGNLGTAQALDTILAAANILRCEPEVRFVMIGSGSRSQWLEQKIQQLSLHNVDMLGRFPPEWMPGLLSQASVLLVTLSRDPIFSHTVPSKIQAYLAAGKPIIASLNGEGAQVVVEAGAGISCAAGDAPALASAVLELRAASELEREQIGKNGVLYYREHFEPALVAKRLVRILADTINGKIETD